MPQQPSGAGEDLAAGDETISFKDEGGPGEIPTKKLADSTTSSRDLNDIKSSLVTEGECKNSSDDQRGIKRGLAPEYGESVKDSVKEQPLFRIYDTVGGSSKLDHPFRYGPHYRFFAGAYPGASMLSTGSKMSVMHPGGPHTPLLMQPPLTASLEIDPKTGIPRSRHGGDIGSFYPLSPGPYSPLEYVQWQRQPFYPFSSTALRSPYPSPLTVSAASIPRLAPTGLPPSHPAMHLPGMPPHPALTLSGKHELLHHHNNNEREREKEAPRPPEKKRPHVKKPLNAFMLYMKEMRAQVVKECTLKESAAINQILGRRWHALSREEQSKYYDLARKERQLHMQLYPGWSARDNYALVSKKKKRKKDKSQGDGSDASTPKKCRARFGVDQQDYWCKPCRRKKKCIRYVSGDEKGDDDDDNSNDHSDCGDDQHPVSSSGENGIMQSDERHSPVPVPVSHPALMNGNSDSHSQTSQSSSTAHTQSRSPQSIPSHCVQTFVHSPQPQLATHPIAYTPPLMLYPQPAFLTHSSHSGFTGALTGQSPLHVLPRPPPQRLLELSESPQDLSMKTATVTA